MGKQSPLPLLPPLQFAEILWAFGEKLDREAILQTVLRALVRFLTARGFSRKFLYCEWIFSRAADFPVWPLERLLCEQVHFAYSGGLPVNSQRREVL